MSDVWDLGTIVTLTAAFVDGAGDPADPTAITGTVCLPDGTTSDLTPVPVTEDGSPVVGSWTADVYVILSGRYDWAFLGTGAVATGAPGTFWVRESAALEVLIAPPAEPAP
jgi:hypothetical protein